MGSYSISTWATSYCRITVDEKPKNHEFSISTFRGKEKALGSNTCQKKPKFLYACFQICVPFIFPLIFATGRFQHI